MDDESKKVFFGLFKEAAAKCMGHPLRQALTETESKLLYNQIFEATGLVIGWKSLKNYSLFVCHENAKEENPSVATLDTLARYVLNAPYTTETDRKTNESHFPYWFKYKEEKLAGPQPVEANPKIRKYFSGFVLKIVLPILIAILCFYFFYPSKPKNFSTDFHSVNEASLLQDGWFVKDKDEVFWKKRAEKGGMLSLFTLTGDNWLDSVNQPQIKNLLLRKINTDCFTTEVHLQNFVPQQEWQQAGILLMEDTNYNAKTLRLSLAYNDNFGGFTKSKEIIIQGVASLGNSLSHPEEVLHIPVFTLDSNNENLVKTNLTYSGLRIEKSGENIRMLWSCSSAKNSAFKQASTLHVNFHPKYIGLFALQGFVNNKSYQPVYFTSFTLVAQTCN